METVVRGKITESGRRAGTVGVWLIRILLGLALWMELSGWRSMAEESSRKPKVRSVQERLTEFGEPVRGRWAPWFQNARLKYPPSSLVLVGLKQEKQLEVYAAGSDGIARFLRSYPILAASGKPGPKLREGDQQVPEGLYKIELLNPNSSYHLSLRVSYPNTFDRTQAKLEGRTNLGGDIMIHGNAVSIGCIAVGDEAAEDLFVLAALTGLKNIRLILSPVDFRVRELPSLPAGVPSWTPELYRQIKDELLKLKKNG